MVEIVAVMVAFVGIFLGVLWGANKYADRKQEEPWNKKVHVVE